MTSTTFTVNVVDPASITFSPDTPSSFTACNATPLTVTVTGAPTGGTLSVSGTNVGTTTGSFNTTALTGSSGSFLFSGATAVGVATITIVYDTGFDTETRTYTINVNAGALAPLTFSPTSPAAFTSGTATPLLVDADASPAGGVFSATLVSNMTNGSFGAINASTGVFSFSGATTLGQAVLNVTYTHCGTSTSSMYTVEVFDMATITFNPPSPQTPTACDLSVLTVTVNGSPAGGTLSVVGVPSTGGTGGSFVTTGISGDSGSFMFSGATSAGTASIMVMYVSGIDMVTETYTINVSAAPVPTLAFSPTSGNFTACDPGTITVTATTSPTSGTVAVNSTSTATTGGSFSLTDANMNGDGDGIEFTYSGATAPGTASITLTYTPTCGAGTMVTYNVAVASAPARSISFSPTVGSFTACDAGLLTVTVSGTPSGGTLSVTSTNTATTGGIFVLTDSLIGGDGDAGEFTYSGATDPGSATLTLTYDLGCGPTAVMTYTVTVASAPTRSISFSPPTGTFNACSASTLTVTVSGSPSGGTLSVDSTVTGVTGGSFVLTDSQIGGDGDAGEFTYSGATSAGTASITLTYNLGCGPTATMTYNVTVSGSTTTVTFAPTSGTYTACNTSTSTTTVTASPSGGTLAVNSTSTAVTGGMFNLTDSTVNPSGAFTYSGATAAGTASITLTYTPPCGPPSTNTFNVTVSAASAPTLSFSPPTTTVTACSGATATITVNGSPTGGTLLVTASNTATTGGSFTLTDSQVGGDGDAGEVTFSGFINPGSASVSVRYDLGCGPTTTMTYNVTVNAASSLSLTFSPTTPTTFQVGQSALSIDAEGSPTGGTFSTAMASGGTTGGTFGSINSSTGVFSFSGATGAGTATINVTYTNCGTSTTLTYTVNVSLFDPGIYCSLDTPLGLTGNPFLGGNSFIPFYSVIDVPSGEATITDLNVSLDILHDRVQELDLILTSPLGTTVNIVLQEGGTFDMDMGVILEDDSPTFSIVTNFAGTPNNPGPFSTFSPENPLTSFDGQNPAGRWFLNIIDRLALFNSVSYEGTIQSWCLIFNNNTFTLPATISFQASVGAIDTYLNMGETPIVLVGDTVSITAVGTPSTGTFTRSNVNVGTTGGTFSNIGSSSGVFTFTGFNSDGTASVDITYTPAGGTGSSAVTTTFTLEVVDSTIFNTLPTGTDKWFIEMQDDDTNSIADFTEGLADAFGTSGAAPVSTDSTGSMLRFMAFLNTYYRNAPDGTELVSGLPISFSLSSGSGSTPADGTSLTSFGTSDYNTMAIRNVLHVDASSSPVGRALSESEVNNRLENNSLATGVNELGTFVDRYNDVWNASGFANSTRTVTEYLKFMVQITAHEVGHSIGQTLHVTVDDPSTDLPRPANQNIMQATSTIAPGAIFAFADSVFVTGSGSGAGFQTYMPGPNRCCTAMTTTPFHLVRASDLFVKGYASGTFGDLIEFHIQEVLQGDSSLETVWLNLYDIEVNHPIFHFEEKREFMVGLKRNGEEYELALGPVGLIPVLPSEVEEWRTLFLTHLQLWEKMQRGELNARTELLEFLSYNLSSYNPQIRLDAMYDLMWNRLVPSLSLKNAERVLGRLESEKSNRTERLISAQILTLYKNRNFIPRLKALGLSTPETLLLPSIAGALEMSFGDSHQAAQSLLEDFVYLREEARDRAIMLLGWLHSKVATVELALALQQEMNPDRVILCADALGRIGDKRALYALQNTLYHHPFLTLQAKKHLYRAAGMIGSMEAIAWLREEQARNTDSALAYVLEYAKAYADILDINR